MNKVYASVIRQTAQAFPEVVKHLSGVARWVVFSAGGEYKTYEYFLQQIERNVTALYKNNIGGEFIDLMANLISGQFQDAYDKAWKEEGDGGDLPAYLEASYQEAVAKQYDFVDQYYRDIVDARIDETPIDPLLSRAVLWANRYNEEYNKAVALIAKENGGNLIWKLGATEEHCTTCANLDGIVARASEWEALGVHPQGGPNEKLDCKGFRCDCSLEPTDKRRSAGAYGRIEEAIL